MPAIALYTSNMSGVSTAAQALPSLAITQVQIQADKSISATVHVFVGNASGQFFALSAFQQTVVPVSEMSLVYVKTSGGSATINWLAHTNPTFGI